MSLTNRDQPLATAEGTTELDRLLRELRSEGVAVDDRIEEYEYGRFAWIMDPEGNRIELWEPPQEDELDD